MNRIQYLLTCVIVLFAWLPRSLAQVAADYVAANYKKEEVYIPMRDGKRLYTVIYSPKDESRKYPLIMQRTCYSAGPYGEEMRSIIAPNQEMMEEGYIVVYQDVRGRYMSEGTFVNMRPQVSNGKAATSKAIDESTDTYDTIDWLIKNVKNNNGRLGLWGGSYPGFYTAVGSLSNHPALKAASPQAPIGDFYFDDFHHNGSFLSSYFFAVPVFGFHKQGPEKKAWYPTKRPDTFDSYDYFLNMGSLDKGTSFQGEDNFFWQELVEHPDYDTLWQKKSLIPHLKNVKPAIMVVGGWFDAEDLYGPLNIYKSIEKNSKNYNTLVMGPWSHGDWARERGKQVIGDIYFGDSLSTGYQHSIESVFFRHFLQGNAKGNPDLPEAYLFDTGKKEWRSFPQWPLTSAENSTLYFGGGATLGKDKPATGQASSDFVSDPGKPVPYSQAQEVVFTPRSYMTSDQRENASRPDVLVFETEVLEEDVTIGGELLADLFVSTTGTDADWVVKLIDVLPSNPAEYDSAGEAQKLSNYHMLVRSEIMPGRYRNGFEKAVPFKPGEVTEVKVKLQDVLHTFQKGHRIQVQVQSSWFPLFNRNPQTFVDNVYKAEPEHYRTATHRVFHSATHPSSINVQIIK